MTLMRADEGELELTRHQVDLADVAHDVVPWLIWIKEEAQTRPTVTAERMERRHESQRYHDLAGDIGRAG